MLITFGLTQYMASPPHTMGNEGRGRATVNTSIRFAPTVTRLLLPLTAGRTVTLLPEASEIEALAHALTAQNDYWLLKLTPAHLDALRRLLDPATLAGQARTLVVGGEQLTAAMVEFWRTHAPSTRIPGLYRLSLMWGKSLTRGSSYGNGLLNGVFREGCSGRSCACAIYCEGKPFSTGNPLPGLRM